jgi:uncharacterized protein with PIN domain
MVSSAIRMANSLPVAKRMPTTFAAEKTLGRLVKWLRLMGFDTLSESQYPNGSFLQRIGPDRIFLTRTQRLAGERRGLKTIFIQANDPADQVVELIREAGLRPDDIQSFSRCIICNERIIAVAKHAVRRSVPDYVWNNQVNFSTCPKCGRVFWRGTHTERALKTIMEFFNEPPPA